jgi:hypothetical protein
MINIIPKNKAKEREKQKNLSRDLGEKTSL